MIKFKNIYLNIGLINNEVKMKKLEKMKADNSHKENDNYMQSLKSNESLKKVLFKAKNISTTLMTNIVPQLATSIKSVVAEMMSNKNITKLKDWNTIKFLRQHIDQQDSKIKSLEKETEKMTLALLNHIS